jgi:hypothetical protein
VFPDFPGNFFIIAGERRYKAKQQKGKTTRQKKDPNEPQAVVDMMGKTMTKIRTIDMSA